MNHTRQELINLAEGGNQSAIEELVKLLFQENDIIESCKWATRGAEAGSAYCMNMAVPLLTINARAGVKVAGSIEAENSLDKLIQAIKYADTLEKAGVLKEPMDLSSTYAEMVWCYFLLGINTENTTYFQEAVDVYLKLSKECQSEVDYAYVQSLDKLGKKTGIIDKKKALVDKHDDTLEDYMIEDLCADIIVAYLEGNGVKPDYDIAAKYAKVAKQCNPENELAVLFENGDLRKEFNQMHGQKENTDSPTLILGSGDNGKTSGGKSKGCYIATSVYGSYDCPEVWVLRRFRDNVLDVTWYGRAFIKMYYTISPKLVKTFGDKEWFGIFWKNKLDRLVNSLKEKGFQDTRYND